MFCTSNRLQPLIDILSPDFMWGMTMRASLAMGPRSTAKAKCRKIGILPPDIDGRQCPERDAANAATTDYMAPLHVRSS